MSKRPITRLSSTSTAVSNIQATNVDGDTESLNATVVNSDTESSNSGDIDLEELISCCVCDELQRHSPIMTCKNGHILCPNCELMMKKSQDVRFIENLNCPCCRISLAQRARNLTATRLLDWINEDKIYACCHGCDFKSTVIKTI